MIFNNLQTFNNTLTLIIIGFNKYDGSGNGFIITDNCKGVRREGIAQGSEHMAQGKKG